MFEKEKEFLKMMKENLEKSKYTDVAKYIDLENLQNKHNIKQTVEKIELYFDELINFTKKIEAYNVKSISFFNEHYHIQAENIKIEKVSYLHSNFNLDDVKIKT